MDEELAQIDLVVMVALSDLIRMQANRWPNICMATTVQKNHHIFRDKTIEIVTTGIFDAMKVVCTFMLFQFSRAHIIHNTDEPTSLNRLLKYYAWIRRTCVKLRTISMKLN